jgi:alkanesulfonate monooxygenase SsuD/methylene tetrahydromethanopterin reductase-like flavin-dependent oxidoreductase (luciferase family)
MSVPFGVSFDGFVPVRDAAETARLAERSGARSFWIAEHLGYRDSIVTATAIALATERARIFPTALSPYLRHPMPTAMAIASLEELVPHRAGVAIGVGNPMFLRESGLEVQKPVAAIRSYVTALRALFQAGPVQQQGSTFTLNGARLSFSVQPPAPIYLAPMGPHMLKLSGEIADGLVLSAGLSVQFLRHSLSVAAEGAKAAGRDPATLRKTAYVYFIAGGEEREQRLKVRQKLAFLFRNENLHENIRASSLPIDHDGIIDAVARRDSEGALALVPDEAADAFAITGSKASCARSIQDYIDAGLEEIVLSFVGTQEDRMTSLNVLREL